MDIITTECHSLDEFKIQSRKIGWKAQTQQKKRLGKQAHYQFYESMQNTPDNKEHKNKTKLYEQRR